MDLGLSYIKAKTDTPLTTTTLGNLVEEFAERFKDAIIVSSREQKKNLTTSEFFEEVDNFTAALYDVGFQRKDKIGIIVNNSVEALVANYACIRGGFVLVNLNPAVQSSELEYYLKTLKIKCVICVDKYRTINVLDLLKKVVPEFGDGDSDVVESQNVPSLKRVIVISDTEYRGTTKYDTLRSLGKATAKETLKKNQKLIDCYDLVTILFTSGSTGPPKIVGLTHHQLTNCIYFLRKRLPLLQPNGKFCFNLPLFHIFGLGFCSLCMSIGVTIVLPSLYYNPEKNLEAISEDNCTCIMGTPTMLADLVKAQKEKNLPLSPSTAICGGGAGSTQLYRDILEVLHVERLKIGYGASETAAISWPIAGHFNDFSSLGHLMDHLEAKVVNGDGEIVPIGTVGEIYIKGYSVIKNYLYNDTTLLDEDGWFKTGDAGFFDKQGLIYLAGRLKDIINRGGEKISPGEVEDILESFSGVLEVYVVGTYHERFGEEVCACFKLKPGSSITLEEVKMFCKGKLSYYKIPSRIEILDGFPKTALGKIQKSKLTELLNTKVIES